MTFDELKGKTLTKVEQIGDDRIRFEAACPAPSSPLTGCTATTGQSLRSNPPFAKQERRMTEQTFYGWYEDASQPVTDPTFEPPHDAPCPFCGVAISADDVRTHSLMYRGQYAARSYFYRTHRTCAEKDASGTGKDGFILDMIKHNGD